MCINVVVVIGNSCDAIENDVFFFIFYLFEIDLQQVTLIGEKEVRYRRMNKEMENQLFFFPNIFFFLYFFEHIINTKNELLALMVNHITATVRRIR